MSTDHYDEAERMLRRGDAGSLVAALIHAVLAVAQRFEGSECLCEDASPIAGLNWPTVTDIHPKGDVL